MAALKPIDPPDPNEYDDPEDEENVRVDVCDRYYLALYRKTLEEIAHSPEYMESGCPDDEIHVRCPRCLAREVLSS